MIRQAISEAKKPKNFFITLPRPNSRKWEVTTNRPESNAYEISVDEENWSINFDGEPKLYVYEKDGHVGVDWDNDWDWGSFGSSAGKKIENMIKYFKGLE